MAEMMKNMATGGVKPNNSDMNFNNPTVDDVE
jgi:hypothetical protein